jgi:hypothetical protein
VQGKFETHTSKRLFPHGCSNGQLGPSKLIYLSNFALMKNILPFIKTLNTSSLHGNQQKGLKKQHFLTRLTYSFSSISKILIKFCSSGMENASH